MTRLVTLLLISLTFVIGVLLPIDVTAQGCQIEIGGPSRTKTAPASGGQVVMPIGTSGDCTGYAPDTWEDSTRLSTEPFGIVVPKYARTISLVRASANVWNWTVEFDANDTGVARFAYLNIAFRSSNGLYRTGGTWYPITQLSAPVCASLSISRQAIGSEGGMLIAHVTTTTPACSWQLRSSELWLRPRVLQGNGPQDVDVEVRPNLRAASRSATIQLGATVLTLIQTDGGVQIRDPHPQLIAAVDRGAIPPAAVLDQLPRRTGAATDGLAQLLLVVRSRSDLVFTVQGPTTELTGRLSAYTASMPSSNGVVSSSDIVTASPSVDGRVVVVYTPPSSFEALGDHRMVNIRVGDAVTGEEVLAPIELIRPPVVLIHGYNSGPSVWDAFARVLTLRGYRHVLRADYSVTSFKSFNPDPGVADAVLILEETIFCATEAARAAGAAAVRADVVAHSMGGLVTRAYAQQTGQRVSRFGARICGIPSGAVTYRSSENYQQGTIRRLITLGTPHQGSRFGELLWRAYTNPNPSPAHAAAQNAIFAMFGVGAGAVEALGSTSDAFTFLDAWTPVRAHTIVADSVASGTSVVDSATTNVAVAAINVVLPILGCDSLTSLFDGQAHDIIVEASSEAGGLSGSAFSTTIPGLWHVQEPQSDRVMTRVAELLSGPWTTFATQVGGGRLQRRPPVCSGSYTTTIPASLQIQPLPNSTPPQSVALADSSIRQGATAVLVATVTMQTPPATVSFFGPFGVVQAPMAQPGVYTATVSMNGLTGSSGIGVVGSIGTTVVVGASTVAIEPQGTPLEIRTVGLPGFIRHRDANQIEIEGRYAPSSGGSDVWQRLTGLEGLTYTVSRGADLITVTPNGMLSALAPGEVSLVIGYRGVTTSVTFTVDVPCTFSISANRTRFGASGGIGTIDVVTERGCTWSVAAAGELVQLLSSPQVRGTGRVGFRVNPSPGPATATLSVAGQQISIVNTGAPALAGDLDGDGSVDLLWQHDDGRVAVWLMHGPTLVDGRPLGLGTLPDAAWRIAASGDFDHDGNIDVVFQHADGRIAMWLMSGAAMLSGSLVGPGRVADTRWKIRASADMNGDGWLDLVWQHESSGEVAAWFMRGTALVDGRLLTPHIVGDLRWRIVAAGDMNRDGHADLIWQHETNGTLAAWLMNGTVLMRGVSLSPEAVTDTNWTIRGLADFNLDGQPDLIWQNVDTGMLSVWLMNGLTLVDGLRITPFVVPDTRWRIVGPR